MTTPALRSRRDSPLARGAYALLRVYRRWSAPRAPNCRYLPSCSEYAEEAVVLHGPVRGAWLAGRRILRCHPLRPGGLDPVPAPRLRES